LDLKMYWSRHNATQGESLRVLSISRALKFLTFIPPMARLSGFKICVRRMAILAGFPIFIPLKLWTYSG